MRKASFKNQVLGGVGTSALVYSNRWNLGMQVLLESHITESSSQFKEQELILRIYTSQSVSPNYNGNGCLVKIPEKSVISSQSTRRHFVDLGEVGFNWNDSPLAEIPDELASLGFVLFALSKDLDRDHTISVHEEIMSLHRNSPAYEVANGRISLKDAIETAEKGVLIELDLRDQAYLSTEEGIRWLRENNRISSFSQNRKDFSTVSTYHPNSTNWSQEKKKKVSVGGLLKASLLIKIDQLEINGTKQIVKGFSLKTNREHILSFPRTTLPYTHVLGYKKLCKISDDIISKMYTYVADKAYPSSTEDLGRTQWKHVLSDFYNFSCEIPSFMYQAMGAAGPVSMEYYGNVLEASCSFCKTTVSDFWDAARNQLAVFDTPFESLQREFVWIVLRVVCRMLTMVATLFGYTSDHTNYRSETLMTDRNNRGQETLRGDCGDSSKNIYLTYIDLAYKLPFLYNVEDLDPQANNFSSKNKWGKTSSEIKTKQSLLKHSLLAVIHILHEYNAQMVVCEARTASHNSHVHGGKGGSVTHLCVTLVPVKTSSLWDFDSRNNVSRNKVPGRKGDVRNVLLSNINFHRARALSLKDDGSLKLFMNSIVSKDFKTPRSFLTQPLILEGTNTTCPFQMTYESLFSNTVSTGMIKTHAILLSNKKNFQNSMRFQETSKEILFQNVFHQTSEGGDKFPTLLKCEAVNSILIFEEDKIKNQEPDTLSPFYGHMVSTWSMDQFLNEKTGHKREDTSTTNDLYFVHGSMMSGRKLHSEGKYPRQRKDPLKEGHGWYGCYFEDYVGNHVGEKENRCYRDVCYGLKDSDLNIMALILQELPPVMSPQPWREKTPIKIGQISAQQKEIANIQPKRILENTIISKFLKNIKSAFSNPLGEHFTNKPEFEISFEINLVEKKQRAGLLSLLTVMKFKKLLKHSEISAVRLSENFWPCIIRASIMHGG